MSSEGTNGAPGNGTSRYEQAIELLAGHWPEMKKRHKRQDASRSLGGGLLRSGWSVERAESFVEAVATKGGDEEAEKRVATVADTAEKIKANGHCTGWSSLGKLLGKEPLRQL